MTTTFPENTRGITISHKDPSRITSYVSNPYVIFTVTPESGGSSEFIDMFISASYKPDNIILSTEEDFTDYAIISTNKIIQYNDGWFYVQRFPRTQGKKVLLGKILYVKINFPDDNLHFYDLKIVKTGFREIIG